MKGWERHQDRLNRQYERQREVLPDPCAYIVHGEEFVISPPPAIPDSL
jgi:hypothetical protein